MQGIRDFLELLVKATNVRLNIAILLVSSLVLFLAETNRITIESVYKTGISGLVFLTTIRLVYAAIGLLNSIFQQHHEKRQRLRMESEDEERKILERIKEKDLMVFSFEKLDVFQLFVIQDLKKQNHITLKKGAPLFTLKKMNIIYSVASGEHHESVCLTLLAKELLEERFWASFDELKFNALYRFFSGMQPEDMVFFKEFLIEDVIITKRVRPHPTTGWYLGHEKTFSNLSCSIVFSQPQQGYSYKLDSIAKKALCKVLENES
ncbi:hypothetical protein [Aeromonas hydrophila]|uniref:hypothetical protein n=1 Tax=Aeromonas hydrophila TaxID=644 RepID=UPI00111726C6|nr:hypothetical protein [Aeromonas hydrophila]